MQRKAQRRSHPRAPRATSGVLLLLAAALVLLHAILLWQRLDDRSIVRPEVAMRWIMAAAIGGAALLLRRVSSTPRGWVVLWLTVALLHLAGPASAALTQAVLMATPLLLLFVAAVICLTCSSGPFFRAGTGSLTCGPVIAAPRDRAPPPR